MWSSCSPDFGVRSVVDRFAQIEPRVLLAVDGYRYGDRDHDRLDVVRALQDAMPSLERTVVLGYLDADHWAVATPFSRDLPLASALFHDNVPRVQIIEAALEVIIAAIGSGSR